jgi:hypothetical protein
MDAQQGEWLHVLQPLWAAWGALAKARAQREPLELELPEKRVVLDAAGRIAGISIREHLAAHRMIEDYMIAANVAAAKALEKKKAGCIFRCHEAPSREKIVALRVPRPRVRHLPENRDQRSHGLPPQGRPLKNPIQPNQKALFLKCDSPGQKRLTDQRPDTFTQAGASPT